MTLYKEGYNYVTAPSQSILSQYSVTFPGTQWKYAIQYWQSALIPFSLSHTHMLIHAATITGHLWEGHKPSTQAVCLASVLLSPQNKKPSPLTRWILLQAPPAMATAGWQLVSCAKSISSLRDPTFIRLSSSSSSSLDLLLHSLVTRLSRDVSYVTWLTTLVSTL